MRLYSADAPSSTRLKLVSAANDRPNFIQRSDVGTVMLAAKALGLYKSIAKLNNSILDEDIAEGVTSGAIKKAAADAPPIGAKPDEAKLQLVRDVKRQLFRTVTELMVYGDGIVNIIRGMSAAAVKGDSSEWIDKLCTWITRVSPRMLEVMMKGRSGDESSPDAFVSMGPSLKMKTLYSGLQKHQTGPSDRGLSEILSYIREHGGLSLLEKHEAQIAEALDVALRSPQAKVKTTAIDVMIRKIITGSGVDYDTIKTRAAIVIKLADEEAAAELTYNGLGYLKVLVAILSNPEFSSMKDHLIASLPENIQSLVQDALGTIGEADIEDVNKEELDAMIVSAHDFGLRAGELRLLINPEWTSIYTRKDELANAMRDLNDVTKSDRLRDELSGNLLTVVKKISDLVQKIIDKDAGNRVYGKLAELYYPKGSAVLKAMEIVTQDVSGILQHLQGVRRAGNHGSTVKASIFSRLFRTADGPEQSAAPGQSVGPVQPTAPAQSSQPAQDTAQAGVASVPEESIASFTSAMDAANSALLAFDKLLIDSGSIKDDIDKAEANARKILGVAAAKAPKLNFGGSAKIRSLLEEVRGWVVDNERLVSGVASKQYPGTSPMGFRSPDDWRTTILSTKDRGKQVTNKIDELLGEVSAA